MSEGLNIEEFSSFLSNETKLGYICYVLLEKLK